MKNITAIRKGIEKYLDDKEETKEFAIRESRKILRMCRTTIHEIHRGRGDAEKKLERMKNTAEEMLKKIKKHPDVMTSSIVENALQEIAEAHIFYYVLTKDELPRPSSIGVTPAAYLLGMGDAVGELRRYAQECMKNGKIDESENALEKMETLYEFLMHFVYPSSVVRVKQKQDVARALIEKTRSELLILHLRSR